MMAPSIALDADGLALAIGAAGGTRLRTALVRRRGGDPRRGPRAAGGRRPAARAPRPATSSTPSRAWTRTRWPSSSAAASTVRRWADPHHYFGGVSLVATRWRGCRPAPQRARAFPVGTDPSGSVPYGRRDCSVASTSRAIWSISACSLVEDLLVAEPLPQLDHEALAVQVAGEAEQERLDAQLVAAVVRVRADRDRRAVPGGEARRRSRAAGRAGRARRRRSPSGSRACRPRASPSTTMPSTSGGRPSSAAAAVHLALVQKLADRPTTRRPRAAVPGATSKPSSREQREVAAAAVAEAEVLAGDDHLGADRLAGTARANSLGLDPLRSRA